MCLNVKMDKDCLGMRKEGEVNVRDRAQSSDIHQVNDDNLAVA